MRCPACGNELEQMTAGNVVVDVCQGGCGGIWFDRFELRKFDEPHESEGDILLDIERDDRIRVDRGKRRECPKCDRTVMMRHFSSPKRQVEVDECPRCGGFWLDAGELAALRDQFATEAERKEAAERYFEEVFGDALAKLRAEDEADHQKIRRIARMFRFLCPSYYVPGKQDWGAF